MLIRKQWLILCVLVCILSSGGSILISGCPDKLMHKETLDTQVIGHGRLLDPPARTSMWRFDFKTHKNVNDNALFCGGHKRYVNSNYRCGICGEAWDSDRNYDGGGRYATGIIVRNYTMGEVIDVTVDLTANHLGYYVFRICPHNNYRTRAKQECLNKHPLELADGSGTRVKVESNMNLKDTFRLRLPKDITCEQCVFQWSYYTQLTRELFQNCADVSIRAPQDIVVTTPTTKLVTCKAIGKMEGMDHWCESYCQSGHCIADYGQYCICFFNKI